MGIEVVGRDGMPIVREAVSPISEISKIILFANLSQDRHSCLHKLCERWWAVPH